MLHRLVPDIILGTNVYAPTLGDGGSFTYKHTPTTANTAVSHSEVARNLSLGSESSPRRNLSTILSERDDGLEHTSDEIDVDSIISHSIATPVRFDDAVEDDFVSPLCLTHAPIVDDLHQPYLPPHLSCLCEVSLNGLTSALRQCV